MHFGRPPKYETPEDMQKIIDLYFLACRTHQTGDIELLADCSEDELLIINDIEDKVPTVSGLAYILGMSRQALCDYEKKDDFLDTVKKAKLRIERSLEQRLYSAAPAGVIFNLKNNFGWKDKTETEHSGSFNVAMPNQDAGTL
jgi:hypothetical protein